MTQPSLTDNIVNDVRTMLTLLDDVERAVTDDEKAAAGLALETECAMQMAAMVERARARCLAMIGRPYTR